MIRPLPYSAAPLGCCTPAHAAVGVACLLCDEIAAAFGRTATEAPGPVPVERAVPVVSSSLRADSVSALSARLFGNAPVAACTARPVAARDQEHGGATTCRLENGIRTCPQ